jgi:hypothetical protein
MAQYIVRWFDQTGAVTRECAIHAWDTYDARRQAEPLLAPGEVVKLFRGRRFLGQLLPHAPGSRQGFVPRQDSWRHL